jgi:hypothetical protein
VKIQKYNIRGTEMNKLQFSEIEDYLEEKGLNVNEVFNQIADEKEFIYVSNGFISGLKNENEDKEWHHFFKKEEDGNFTAGKLKFK